MSATPEYRFKCDRCLDEIHASMQGSAPVHTRVTAPEGWMTLTIGTDPSTPVSHLCPPCAFGLKAYMSGASISSNVGEPHAEGPALSP